MVPTPINANKIGKFKNAAVRTWKASSGFVKGGVRKIPRLVSAAFKKDTWNGLYASFKKFSLRESDDLFGGNKKGIARKGDKVADATPNNVPSMASKIVMYGSEYTVDENYTPESGKKENNKLNSKEIQNLISTEEDAQLQVEAMKKTMQNGSYEDVSDLWAQPIRITSYDGKDYILDGHNRLKAIAELNLDLPKDAVLKRLSIEEATKLYKDKMKYIIKGEFNLKISD